MEEIKTKTCNKCGIEKNIDDFRKGRNSCKSCGYEQNKKHVGDCVVCGKPIISSSKNQKTCSVECGSYLKTHKRICIDEKKCKRCGLLKPISDFSKTKTSADGHRHYCSKCEYEKSKKINGTCVICGGNIIADNPNQKTCSTKCMGQYRSRFFIGENNPLYKTTMVTCEYCGLEFGLTPSSFEDVNFCSSKCKKYYYGKIITVKCDTCGADMEKTPSDISTNNFCDRKCMGVFFSRTRVGENNSAYNSIEINCEYCGCKKTIPMCQKRDKNFCSMKCRSAYYSSTNNPNYNHLLTDEERQIQRKYPEYTQWRNDVFERDNYTCQCCKDKKGGSLNAHHINGYNWCIEGRTDVNNGITLCDICHKEYHSIYGYGDNTMLQYFQFMATKKIFTHYQESVIINEKWIKELEL